MRCAAACEHLRRHRGCDDDFYRQHRTYRPRPCIKTSRSKPSLCEGCMRIRPQRAMAGEHSRLWTRSFHRRPCGTDSAPVECLQETYRRLLGYSSTSFAPSYRFQLVRDANAVELLRDLSLALQALRREPSEIREEQQFRTAAKHYHHKLDVGHPLAASFHLASGDHRELIALANRPAIAQAWIGD